MLCWLRGGHSPHWGDRVHGGVVVVTWQCSRCRKRLPESSSSARILMPEGVSFGCEDIHTHIEPRTADEWWAYVGCALHPAKVGDPDADATDALSHCVLALIRDLAVQEAKQ